MALGRRYLPLAGSAAVAPVDGWERGIDDFNPRPPPRFEGPPALALTPATLPPKIAGMAWRQPLDELPFRPRVERPHPGPALALTPATLPPKIGGMAWRQPLDELARRPRIDWPQLAPAFAPKPFAAVVGISGIAWFEPPDRDRPALRISVESQPPIALTPATLPPKIAGMAWFEPPDAFEPRRWYLQDPPAFNQPPITQLIGVPWANWLDVLPKPPPKQQPTAAIALTPDTLPPQIAGIAFFEPPDIFQRRFWYLQDPPAFNQPPITQLIGVPWANWLDVLPLPAPKQQPNAAIALTPVTLPPKIAGMAWRQPLDELARRPRVDWPQLASAFAPLPPPTGVGISGIAWFEPPDRDRPALRINVESQPPIALTPATLPPQISGIAWFEPAPPERKLIRLPPSEPPLAGQSFAAPTPISGMAWFEPPDIFQPKRWYSSDPVLLSFAPVIVTFSFVASDTIWARRPPIDSAPALGRAAQPVGISGIAWFEPRDADRPAIKVRTEAPAALALTPATLPPRIGGMAWFTPPDVLPRAIFRPQWVSGFVFARLGHEALARPIGHEALPRLAAFEATPRGPASEARTRP